MQTLNAVVTLKALVTDYKNYIYPNHTTKKIFPASYISSMTLKYYRWLPMGCTELLLPLPCVFGMTPTYYILKYFEVVLNALHRTVVTLPYI